MFEAALFEHFAGSFSVRQIGTSRTHNYKVTDTFISNKTNYIANKRIKMIERWYFISLGM